jgi:hypothetical protein
MSAYTDLFEELDKVYKLKEKLENAIEVYEPSIWDFTDDYDTFLDDIYEDVFIVGIFYTSSYALKIIRPMDYRLGLQEYVSGLVKEDITEYQQLITDLEEVNESIVCLENEAQNLTQYINNLTNGVHK